MGSSGFRGAALCWLGLAAACYGGGPEPDGGEQTVGTGTDSAGETDTVGDWPDVDIDPQPANLPRLTEAQYRRAVEDLLGPGLPQLPLEPDTNPYLFFSIGAASTTLSELGAQRYEESADAITQHVFSDAQRRADLVECDATQPACVASFVETFGRRAFRRPLADAQRETWIGVANELPDPDAWEGLRLVVAGMLQSPSFLYRVERGEPDPADPARLRLTGYEMASRISFLLWDTIPDDELLAAAEAGELLTDDGLRAQAQRLLEDPRARQTVQDFIAQYLELSRLDGIARDPGNYPQFTETMAQDMRTEVTLLVDDLIYRQGADFRTLFGTRRTFVNDGLAALYGVDAPGASANVFVPVELPANGPRAGMLTLGAFLTMNAHETRTSPTLRGKYVLERVLCAEVPPPPVDVDMEIDVSSDEPKTMREMIEQHAEDPACSGCHGFVDPPGLLFENFDSIGRYRTHDNGFAIDASAEVEGDVLADGVALAELLVDDERVGRCVVKQLFRHATARLDAETEDVVIEDLAARFAAADHDFLALLVEIAAHDGFRHLAQEG